MNNRIQGRSPEGANINVTSFTNDFNVGAVNVAFMYSITIISEINNTACTLLPLNYILLCSSSPLYHLVEICSKEAS